MKNRYLIYFILAGIFLGMFTGVITHNVKADSVYFTDGFEGGTVNAQYSHTENGVTMATESEGGYFRVSSTTVHSGIRSFEGIRETGVSDAKGWWNYTYSNDYILTDFCLWFYPKSISTNYNFILYVSDGNPSNFSNVFLVIQSEATVKDVFWLDSVGASQVIVTDFSLDTWHCVGFSILSNSTIKYFFDDTVVTGSYRHANANPRIDCIHFHQQASGELGGNYWDDVEMIFMTNGTYSSGNVYDNDNTDGTDYGFDLDGTGGSSGTGGVLCGLSEANQMFIGVFISLAVGIGLLVITRQPIVFVAGTSITAFLLSSSSMGTFQLMPTEFGVGIIVVLVLIGVIAYLTT